MSGNSDRAAWQVTTDREQVREWAETHETAPVLAEETGGTGLLLLSNPDDDRGEQLSWDQFFERFEAQSLALRYRETATRGEGQPAYEFVGRDELGEAEASGEADPDTLETDAQEGDDDVQSTPPGTEGGGVTQVDSGTAARRDERATESETAADVGDDAETDAFVLDEIHEERGPGNDVEDESVTFRNTGDEALDLSGWVVENDSGQRFVFPDGWSLEAGRNVTLHSGRGSDTETDVHWGATSAVWDDDGDTITVRTSDGRAVLREPYLK